MRIAKKPADTVNLYTDTISPYAKSVEYIKQAIETLGESAKTDEVSRDAIADLSVVLLYLKHKM